MRFNRNARLDTSQVRDRRGSGTGGLGGIRIGRAGAAGGGIGIVGVIAVVLYLVFSGGGSGGGSGLPGGLLGELSGGGSSGSANNADLEQECHTGADADAKDDCAVVAIVNSVQAFWTDEMAGADTRYRDAPTVFYSGSTPTGCGQGTAQMGPFYCPTDATVYVDLTFWNDLKTEFGADNSVFTQAYVIAHEYGHHVQDLLGTTDHVGTAAGAGSDSVRLELQADCYAGVWAKHASTVAGDDGQTLITDISDTDIANAVATAGKIGDDWIQAHLGGRNPDPSTYTHGTAHQRQRWFTTGYRTGDPGRCDTFSASDLG